MTSKNANELILDLKEKMSKSASEVKLQSLFLIGSCSEDVVLEEWYQDYDIHFLFNEIYIPTEKLDWLRTLLENVSKNDADNCKTEWFVKDRHWKMVPQPSYPINIGIHATLLNSADHFRRLHYNSVLASNMYGRCQLLHGIHPISIRGVRPPSFFDYAHSVGGIGWLAENFSRAVSLYQLDPNDHTFYPFIAGYCWNVASSLMFHIYYLNEGKVSGRKKAYEYFLNLSHVQNNFILSEAAMLLHKNKENYNSEKEFAILLINATGVIIDFVKSEFLTKYGKFSLQIANEALKGNDNNYVISKSIGNEYHYKVVDIYRNENLLYYDSISIAIEKIKKEYGKNISPKENFEFIRELLSSQNVVTKFRIWDSLSTLRLHYSHDFEFDRGINGAASIIFGWEDGVQTLLQRMNEIYIEKSGKNDSESESLCDYIYLLSKERLKLLGFDIAKNNHITRFNELRLELSKFLELYCSKNLNS